MRWLKILNELAKIVAQISEIIYDFLLVKTYLAGNDGYKFLLVFPQVFPPFTNIRLQ